MHKLCFLVYGCCAVHWKHYTWASVVMHTSTGRYFDDFWIILSNFPLYLQIFMSLASSGFQEWMNKYWRSSCVAQLIFGISSLLCSHTTLLTPSYQCVNCFPKSFPSSFPKTLSLLVVMVMLCWDYRFLIFNQKVDWRGAFSELKVNEDLSQNGVPHVPVIPKSWGL